MRVGDRRSGDEQRKCPSGDGVKYERGNRGDCPEQGGYHLHDRIPHRRFTHCFTLVHRVCK